MTVDPPAAPRLDGASILLIDDDEGRRGLTGDWLSSDGAEVVGVSTGSDGLELARSQPDLVICEVHLPDMSGLEVTATLKSDPVLRTIPVIQRSSVDIGGEARIDGLTSGADAYLIEPIDRSLLVATATSLLRFRAVSQELEAALAIDVTGVFDWTIATGLVRWSESLEAIHGFETGAFGGTFDDFLATVHTDDRERLAAELERSLARDDSIDVAFRFVRTDGSHGWMESRGSIFRDGAGRAVRMLGLAHDVTARMVERSRLVQLRRLASELNSVRTTSGVLKVVRHELRDGGVDIAWVEEAADAAEDVLYSYVTDQGRLDLIGAPSGSGMTEHQAVAIGELAGGALDRALRFEAERDNAVALQRALLPTSVPKIDGWHLDAEYLPASSSDRLGGDFFDVVEVEDGFVVVLGDVAGHGLDATRQMGTVRTLIRTMACAHEGRPDEVIRRAATLFQGVCGPDAPFVTTIVAHVDRGGHVTLASAGHPAPIVFAGGRSTTIELQPTPPLGVVISIDPNVAHVHLEAGDWLACYSDGVFEGRREPLADVVGRLAPQLPAVTSAADIIELGEVVEDLNQDDRAVIVVRRV